ncbi:MAG: NADAR family protein [Cytophagales bacterium]|nr:NADAR family protein [Cytophagales bacterium]
MKYSREQLEKEYDAGKKMKFLFFWGHRKSDELTSTCFSQWWSQTFEVNGIQYPTAEHYMMAEKARLFNDKAAEQRILKASSPGEAKKIGRQVIGFDQETWEANRMKIVVKGNYEKFRQDPALKVFLLNTGQRIIVEASPVDTIWGIGLDRKSEFAPIPPKWRGSNLLGFALMEVRDLLSQE